MVFLFQQISNDVTTIDTIRIPESKRDPLGRPKKRLLDRGQLISTSCLTVALSTSPKFRTCNWVTPDHDPQVYMQYLADYIV